MTNTNTRKGKSNKTKIMQVRLTQQDFDYLVKAAETMGTDASKLVRQLVQMSINAVKAAEREAEERRKRDDEQIKRAEALLNSGDVEVTLNENE